MASNTTMIHKLQQGINLLGGKITYHQTQFYSQDQDRPINIYIVKKATWDEEKKRNINTDFYLIIDT